MVNVRWLEHVLLKPAECGSVKVEALREALREYPEQKCQGGSARTFSLKHTPTQYRNPDFRHSIHETKFAFNTEPLHAVLGQQAFGECIREAF